MPKRQQEPPPEPPPQPPADAPADARNNLGCVIPKGYIGGFYDLAKMNYNDPTFVKSLGLPPGSGFKLELPKKVVHGSVQRVNGRDDTDAKIRANIVTDRTFVAELYPRIGHTQTLLKASPPFAAWLMSGAGNDLRKSLTTVLKEKLPLLPDDLVLSDNVLEKLGVNEVQVPGLIFQSKGGDRIDGVPYLGPEFMSEFIPLKLLNFKGRNSDLRLQFPVWDFNEVICVETSLGKPTEETAISQKVKQLTNTWLGQIIESQAKKEKGYNLMLESNRERAEKGLLNIFSIITTKTPDKRVEAIKDLESDMWKRVFDAVMDAKVPMGRVVKKIRVENGSEVEDALVLVHVDKSSEAWKTEVNSWFQGYINSKKGSTNSGGVTLTMDPPKPPMSGDDEVKATMDLKLPPHPDTTNVEEHGVHIRLILKPELEKETMHTHRPENFHIGDLCLLNIDGKGFILWVGEKQPAKKGKYCMRFVVLESHLKLLTNRKTEYENSGQYAKLTTELRNFLSTLKRDGTLEFSAPKAKFSKELSQVLTALNKNIVDCLPKTELGTEYLNTCRLEKIKRKRTVEKVVELIASNELDDQLKAKVWIMEVLQWLNTELKHKSKPSFGLIPDDMTPDVEAATLKKVRQDVSNFFYKQDIDYSIFEDDPRAKEMAATDMEGITEEDFSRYETRFLLIRPRLINVKFHGTLTMEWDYSTGLKVHCAKALKTSAEGGKLPIGLERSRVYTFRVTHIEFGGVILRSADDIHFSRPPKRALSTTDNEERDDTDLDSDYDEDDSDEWEEYEVEYDSESGDDGPEQTKSMAMMRLIIHTNAKFTRHRQLLTNSFTSITQEQSKAISSLDDKLDQIDKDSDIVNDMASVPMTKEQRDALSQQCKTFTLQKRYEEQMALLDYMLSKELGELEKPPPVLNLATLQALKQDTGGQKLKDVRVLLDNLYRKKELEDTLMVLGCRPALTSRNDELVKKIIDLHRPPKESSKTNKTEQDLLAEIRETVPPVSMRPFQWEEYKQGTIDNYALLQVSQETSLAEIHKQLHLAAKDLQIQKMGLDVRAGQLEDDAFGLCLKPRECLEEMKEIEAKLAELYIVIDKFSTIWRALATPNRKKKYEQQQKSDKVQEDVMEEVDP